MECWENLRTLERVNIYKLDFKHNYNIMWNMKMYHNKNKKAGGGYVELKCSPGEGAKYLLVLK